MTRALVTVLLIIGGALFTSARGLAAEAVPVTGEDILRAQPEDIVERLMDKHVIMLQEIRADGPLRGGIISTYVIFEPNIQDVYGLLSQSSRQGEFRQELTSVETIEMKPEGPIDEQRLKILFQRYAYRLAFELEPDRYRIAWKLDERFDNDLAMVSGFWELYPMADGRTLGRSGTSIDVGPAVPSFLQDWITRKNIPRTMKHVRRWVNSHGEYRP
jgi:hypothetical protein